MAPILAENMRAQGIARLDSAVAEVFDMMLDRGCAPLEAEFDADERITARICFSGSLSGECLVYASATMALITAEALLGPVSGTSDPIVEDAVGELCNMIAGGWKSKLNSRQATCFISVPAVSRGPLRLDDRFGTIYSRSYTFRGDVFGVSLAF
jgi:chemotaxis protein CheX